MSYVAAYKSGDNLVICDRCGLKMYASQVSREWTGLMVCKDCWEERHPQEFIKSIQDQFPPRVVRTEGEDTFIDVSYISSSITNVTTMFGCQTNVAYSQEFL